MILSREVIASRNLSEGSMTVYRVPSIRYLMRYSFSYGSMWMSLAPFWIAEARTTLTSRTTGASPPCFSRVTTSTSSISSSSSTSSSASSGSSSSALVARSIWLSLTSCSPSPFPLSLP